MAYESVAVPFTQFGNRRGFTATQIAQDDLCREFYTRFRHCFEPLLERDIVLFVEPDSPSPALGGM